MWRYIWSPNNFIQIFGNLSFAWCAKIVTGTRVPYGCKNLTGNPVWCACVRAQCLCTYILIRHHNTSGISRISFCVVRNMMPPLECSFRTIPIPSETSTRAFLFCWPRTSTPVDTWNDTTLQLSPQLTRPVLPLTPTGLCTIHIIKVPTGIIFQPIITAVAVLFHFYGELTAQFIVLFILLHSQVQYFINCSCAHSSFGSDRNDSCIF